MTSPTLLIVAGLDPSGGAGIVADIAVCHAMKVDTRVAATALTIQDGKRVLAVNPVSSDILTHQMDAAFTCGAVHAVKIGMLGTAENVVAVARVLRHHPTIPVVLDTVLNAKDGVALLEADGVAPLLTELLPLATVVTPNLGEAEVLCGFPVRTVDQMKQAAVYLSEKSGGKIAVVIKGGHLTGDEVVDVFFDGHAPVMFSQPRVSGRPPRGTGCRFASALACQLAMGKALEVAVREAQACVRRYIHSKR